MQSTLFSPPVTRLNVFEMFGKKLNSPIGIGYKKNILIIYKCQTADPNKIVTAETINL
jgi:hypothetical protein